MINESLRNDHIEFLRSLPAQSGRWLVLGNDAAADAAHNLADAGLVKVRHSRSIPGQMAAQILPAGVAALAAERDAT